MRDEKPCDACVDAKREYDHRWRSAPERVQRSRINARAQAKAYSRLAALHPGLYHAFYDEVREQLLREAGLEVKTFGANGVNKKGLDA